MHLQEISPTAWAFSQAIEPALNFVLYIPEGCTPYPLIRVREGDPFAPLGEFFRAGTEPLRVRVAVMALPREAAVPDLLDCLLRLKRPSKVAKRPAAELAEYAAEAIIELQPKGGAESLEYIRLEKNGRFVLLVEVGAKSANEEAFQIEAPKIVASLRFGERTGSFDELSHYSDPSSGSVFPCPSSWEPVAVDPVDFGQPYVMRDRELGAIRIMNSSKQFTPPELSKNFAAWFRAEGAVLRGAPLLPGKPVEGWLSHWVYAPLAMLQGVRCQIGVSMLEDQNRWFCVGVIGPSPQDAPWKVAMARWAFARIIGYPRPPGYNQ